MNGCTNLIYPQQIMFDIKKEQDRINTPEIIIPSESKLTLTGFVFILLIYVLIRNTVKNIKKVKDNA